MRKLLAVSLVAAVAMPAFAQVYHGSARIIPPEGGRANEVFLFDAAGNLTGSYDEIAGARTDAWGYRDGAFDGTHVYFGWGGGIARHNADGSDGQLIVSGGGPNGTWRALAYDPTGDNGNGSLWSGDFGDGIVEIDLNGNTLTTFSNPTPAWSLYGLAYDDATGDLLGHSGGGDIIRIDISNPGGGVGSWVLEHTKGPWVSATTSQGGLSGMSELGGDYAAVSQGTPDEFGVYANGGGGAFSFGPIDMQGQTGSNGHLGIAVTPEPSSLLLLGLGAAAFIRRRR